MSGQIPHSFDAETYLLGSIAIDPNVFDRVVDVVKSSDFYTERHATIFKAMETLNKEDRHIDIGTVAEYLKRHNKLEEIGGAEYLAELIDSVPTVMIAEEQAKIIKELSTMRRLITIADKMRASCMSPENNGVNDIMEQAETAMFEISDNRSKSETGFVKVRDRLESVLDGIASRYESESSIIGMPTGFKELDKLTSGFSAGDLVIVAGRPSMGKTTFAINIAENAARLTKKTIAVFSMEMPTDQLVMRMMASAGKLSHEKIRTGSLTNDSDWSKLTSATVVLNDYNIFIDDTAGLSPIELRARVRRLARDTEIGAIVIDYLQLMTMPIIPGRQTNRTNEVSEISRSLKALAKEFGVPVIALSQLSRTLESRADKRPIMSDLRESGAIEQDADIILFVYRDEVYNKDTPEKGMAEIIIGKQRNGPLGTARLTFNGEFSLFSDFDPIAMQYQEGAYGGHSSPPMDDDYFRGDPGH